MVVVCQWPARQLAVYKSLDFIPVLQLFCIFFADSQFTGAQAVFVVIVGIGLNKEKENRRGRKLYPGDVINIEGTIITLS